MRMEGRVGSGVLKKKSSSGCLIIKKPGLNKNTGGGFGGSSESSKEKKRARLVSSDSSSSDEDESLEFMRKRANDKRLKNGSTGCKRKELENRAHDRDNAGIEDGSERKRSRLDLFEFDEYDEFDGNEMRNEFSGPGFKASGKNNNSVKMKESGVSSKRNFVVDKRRKQGSSHFDGSGSRKSKEKGSSSVRNKGFGLEDDEEEHVPLSSFRLKYQETAGESIRLQGKNGVLKVMLNKKKKVDIPSQPENYERKERKGLRSDDVVKKDLVQSPVNSDSKTPENRGLTVDKERSAEKKKKVKPSSSKGRKVEESEVDGVDTVLKLAAPRPEASSSKKRDKVQVERSPGPEHITPAKGKEAGSAKRAGSTEKQKLREKIRQMLLDAGWTIDYRPRRNRDYLDAVYINPSGTAYWSIVKAYDAFKKLSGEDNGTVKADVGSLSSAPLSEDMINKLTRQTKKKIEDAMKRKRKEDGMTKNAKRCAVREAAESSDDSVESEERLSSFMKQKQKSRGKSCKVDQDSGDDISDDLVKMKPRKVRDENISTASKSRVIQGRISKVTGRCTLLVRGSNRDENSECDGFVQYSGKRTVLAWLIDSGTAKLSEKVQYMNRRRSRVMLEGWITRDGIHCGCCSKILTVSKFELHAGSKLRQPFQNIFLESGSSLLQCQIDAWNSQEESLRQDFFSVDVDGDDPDDDTCGICGDGGDLICCDSCPSTFHQTCLGIQLLPSGDWHCPNCTCKFCGSAAGYADEENSSTDNELDRCHFCEKKYHKSCSEKAYKLPQSSNDASLCGPKCQEIYDHLEKNLGIRHELEAGISWSLIQRKDVSDTSQRGFPVRVECNSKIAVASSAMDECFLPIIDRRSGMNMIHNVVYNCGSNFNRLNFCRFYTAILERGDEIIAAASIRLHGDRLAEMPFIATREIYRRQGMCRRLLSAIETELLSLKVRQLVIPAISEHMNTWTTVFGFHELTDVHKKEIKSMNMLVFPGTDMLQKQLVKHENSDGAKVSELTNNQQRLPVPVKKSEVSSSLDQNRQASSDSEGQNRQGGKIEVDVLAAPSDAVHESNNAAPSASNAVCESDILLAHKGSTDEMENTKKESSDNLKCSPTPAEHNACKIEPPCLKSTPISSDETREAAADAIEGIGSEVNSMKVSEDGEPSKNISNGCLDEPHPAGSVSKLSSKDAAVKLTNKNQDSALTSALPDDTALLKAEFGVAVDRPETDKPDGEIETIDLPETNEDLSILEVAVDHLETDKPNRENEVIDHRETNEVLSVTQETIDSPEADKPDGEIETIDLPQTNEDLSIPQLAVDRPETDNPDRENKAIDHPETNEDLSVTQEIIDCPEIDKPDGENRSVDHLETNEDLSETIDCPETDKPDGEKETIDCPETDKPDGEKETIDCPETDKPDGEKETIDRPETGKSDGENRSVDHPETNEDLSDTIDCPETDKPDGEKETIVRPETDEPDGEKETIDRPETDKPDGENRSVDHPESNEDLSEIIHRPETDKPVGEKETIDRLETDEPDGEKETIDLPENDKPDGENRSVDHPENEDLSETIDCPETDEPDGEKDTVDRPETDKSDGVKETIDRPETNALGEKSKSVADEPNVEKEMPCLVPNTAATENHVQ